MKYLSNVPFSSQPANEAYRQNYPFGPTKFERELAEEKNAGATPLAETGWVCWCGIWNPLKPGEKTGICCKCNRPFTG